MPFHDTYLKYIDGTGADLCNTGGRAGGSKFSVIPRLIPDSSEAEYLRPGCTAAIFLKQFVAGLNPEDGEEKEDKAKIAYARKPAQLLHASI